MAENDTTGSPERRFDIHKIYVKDASLETPNSPGIFSHEWKPEIGIQLESNSTKVSEGLHEVVLSVTVTAKLGESTAYLVEVQQAGLFMTQGFNDDEMGHLLGSFCPGTLFPFTREAIASLVGKAGFPKLYLKPVNFDAIYMQQRQRLHVPAEDAGSTAH
jgi:preprotein translocase subunit SecB